MKQRIDMTKPHEETWTAGALFIACGEDRGHFDGDPEVAQARMRLAAQAPAMARLLLDLEWRTLTFDNDPWCVTCERRESQGHAPDCRLVAVLRAAGVLP